MAAFSHTPPITRKADDRVLLASALTVSPSPTSLTMDGQSVRPSLRDLQDGNFDTSNIPSAAKVARKPPPSVSTQSQPRSSHARAHQPKLQGERINLEDLFGEDGADDVDDVDDKDVDDDDLRPPIMRPSPFSVIKDIKERSAGQQTPPSRPSQASGFPQVSRRSEGDGQTGTKKISRFKASLIQQKQASSDAPIASMSKQLAAKDAPSEQATIPETSSSLHADIDRETDQVLGTMSEEEILEEQAKLMEMLGEDMVSFIRKRGTQADTPSDAAQPPPRPRTSSAHSRTVRFNEEVSYSNPPSRSPSPPARRTPILLPASDDATIGNWLQDTSESGQVVRDAVEGTPEDIRQRFFPQEPLNASTEWMRDQSDDASTHAKDQTTSVVFDITGKATVKALGDDHAQEADRHAGQGESFTIAQLVQLARSAVAPQRLLALQTIYKAVAEATTHLDSPSAEVLFQSDTINQVLAVCARGLADRGTGIVITSISIFHVYSVTSKSTLNAAAAILTVQPSPLVWFSRLLSPDTATVEIPSASKTAILEILRSLLATNEDFVSAEVIETPRLLENVSTAFLQTQWPIIDPAKPLPNPTALQVLSSIVSRTRANAEQVAERRLEQGAMRFIAIPPWTASDPEHTALAFQLATGTLGVLCELGKYGLGCSNLNISASLLRNIESWIASNAVANLAFSKQWFELLEVWSDCALDPHSTTPEHDLLWAETQEWGEHEIMVGFEQETSPPLDLLTAICGALASWLDGAKKHSPTRFTAAQGRLKENGRKLSAMVDQCTTEPVSEDKANLLLALKRLVKAGEVGESLCGSASSQLARVQVEEAVPLADHGDEDEGWM